MFCLLYAEMCAARLLRGPELRHQLAVTRRGVRRPDHLPAPHPPQIPHSDAVNDAVEQVATIRLGSGSESRNARASAGGEASGGEAEESCWEARNG